MRGLNSHLGRAHHGPARQRRGEVGRNEILIGVAVVALLLLIAVPFGISKSKKSRRAEVPLLVKAIHQAEVDYKAAFAAEGFVTCEAAPRPMHAVDKEPTKWASNRGFDRLAWAPEAAEVYGAYKVTVDGDNFVVNGACDIDGDGERALFKATKDDVEAVMETEASVY